MTARNPLYKEGQQTCFRCGEPCGITLLCGPCHRRYERHFGNRTLVVLGRQLVRRYPETDWSGRRVSDAKSSKKSDDSPQTTLDL